MPFSVSPNPNRGIFRLNYGSELNVQELQLRVFDVAGSKILEMSGTELTATNQVIDLQKFGSGVYFLEIVEGGHAYALKLVVY